MINSLSNDRKVILKSGITGLILIALSVSCFSPVSTLQQLITIFGIIATYWFIPTWFSRNRQLEKKEVKHPTSKTKKTKKSNVLTYQYFNTEGEEVIPCSHKEKLICLVVSIVITLILFLIFNSYKFLQTSINFSIYKDLIIDTPLILFFVAPYLVRHTFYFYKNLPIGTSFHFAFVNSTSIFNNSKSSFETPNLSKQFSSPEYSYLTGNIYNHRNY